MAASEMTEESTAYTSWDRSQTDAPVLLLEDGPEQLGIFTKGTAEVEGATWKLDVDPKLGASATLPDGRVFRAAGNLKKDNRIEASLDGRTFSLINENSGDWIIDNVDEDKLAQFSSRNNGVRKSIVEFEPGALQELGREEVAALSWFARLIMEERLAKSSIAIIVTLILLSAVALVTVLL